MHSWQRTLGIMIVAQLMSSVGFSIIFPFLPRYVDALGSHFGLSIALLAAAVFSAQALTMMLASPFWGALSDRVGRKPMVERAAYGGALTLALMAFAPHAEALVLLRALQGAVTGTVSAANALVAANVPRDRVGYAMGLLQLGMGGGVALGPLLGGVLSDAFGYQTTLLVTAALCFGSGLLVSFGVRETFVRPAEGGPRPGILANYGRILHLPGVGITFVLSFLLWLARNMLIPILPLFVATLPVVLAGTNTVIGLIVAAAAASATLAAVVIGRLGDRIGYRAILVGCSLAAALSYAPQAFVTDVWQLLALQLLSGVAVGGMTPAIAALLSRYSAPGEEGVVYGLENSIVAGSRTVAPMIGAGVVVLVQSLAPASAAPGVEYRSIFVLTSVLFVATAAIAAYRLPGAASEASVAEERRAVPAD